MFYALAFMAGYAACVFTWDKAKALFVGAETEIRALEDKIKALKL